MDPFLELPKPETIETLIEAIDIVNAYNENKPYDEQHPGVILMNKAIRDICQRILDLEAGR